MDRSINVSCEEFAAALGMKVIEAGSGSVVFTSAEIGRPGLQLTGYYNHFAPRRVQLIGNSEMHYIYGMESDEAHSRLDRFMQSGIPCIVVARSNAVPDTLIECARTHSLPVFLSPLTTDDIGHRITNFLSRKLAPSVMIHGVLLDVFGVGILLRGPSGIGKSETALEMVKEGHRLVADDVVVLTKVNAERLVGHAPEATRCLVEARGIGIVDVRYLFGVGAVVEEKSVDLIMELELLEGNGDYDRFGGEARTTEILGVSVPASVIPVSPGRNLAVVVEVAARNFILKRMGYDTSGNFSKKARGVLERN